MKAYILGCSHAAGSEMEKEPGLVFETPLDAQEFGYTRSYPAKIAQALGYEIENHAIPGGSNDAIYRIFCSLPVQPKDIVIVCWTGVDRTELYYDKEQRWIPISHGVPNVNNHGTSKIAKQGINLGSQISEANEFKEYAKQWAVYEINGFRGELNKAKNIEALNARAIKKGIKVINIDSFSTIDCDPLGIWPVKITFCNWCMEQKSAHTDYGHYFEPTHQKFADYCLKHIDRQQI